DAWTLALGHIAARVFFRPLGAFIASLWLRLPLQPLSSHLSLVLVNAANCDLLYLLVGRFRSDIALISAVTFAIAPTTVFVAAWIAACFDAEYVFFGLAALLAALEFWRGGRTFLCLGSVAAFACGLLCKESEIVVLPAMAALWLLDRPRASARRFAILCLGVFAVLGLYAVVRGPALLAIGADGAGGYKFGGLIGAASNAFAYFCWPFAVSQAEISDLLQRNPTIIAFAAVLHAVLILTLALRFGSARALAYLALYFTPLLPVLVISKYETQYTYASGVAISIAMASLFRSRTPWVIGAALLSGLLLWHSATIEAAMYDTGLCQTRARATAMASLRSLAPVGDNVAVFGDDDAPWWVAARAFYQNPFEIGGHTIQLTLVHDNKSAALMFTKDCSVLPSQTNRHAP
ncbi:MAG TPA: glycosyltransferase family 39 protein, partial [Caulobacteraceae bacterium]|nr:glycosyltransferase family 39 protein [Caulobacteraceae bacterium]